MQSIYERIEYLIKQKGMTKKLFCTELGISTGNLGDWKRQKSTPSTNKLVEIAAYFDVSLDWLILGRESQSIFVKEQKSEYILADLEELEKLAAQLSEQEKDFIKEYIEFSAYRRRENSGQE